MPNISGMRNHTDRSAVVDAHLQSGLASYVWMIAEDRVLWSPRFMEL
jgi:hypothetical protein